MFILFIFKILKKTVSQSDEDKSNLSSLVPQITPLLMIQSNSTIHPFLKKILKHPQNSTDGRDQDNVKEYL